MNGQAKKSKCKLKNTWRQIKTYGPEFRDIAKESLRGNFIATLAYLHKENLKQVLTLHSKEQEKEQSKPKAS